MRGYLLESKKEVGDHKIEQLSNLADFDLFFIFIFHFKRPRTAKGNP